MVDYSPLWRTMEEKQITTYTLINQYEINSRTINDIVNITLHFFLKDVRSMLPPAVNHSIAVS